MNPLRWRLWLNLGLAAVVVALGGWMAWRTLYTVDTLTLISDLPAQQVRSLRIERVGRPSISLGLRGDGRWWMDAPIEIPADPARVNTLIRLPAKASFGAYPLTKTEPAELGLDPPLATVVLNGGRVSVGIGGVNPLNNRRYVLVGETVHLVTDTIGDLYSENAAAAANRYLLPSDVRIVSLGLPGLSIRHRPDGGWETEPPVADTKLAERLVNRWQRDPALLVEWWPRRQLDASSEVVVSLEDGRTLHFAIERRGRVVDLIRRDLDLYYRFSPQAAARLLDTRVPVTGH